jgi:hypothetical protein
MQAQWTLFHDVFGDPFRPVDLDPAVLARGGGLAATLAQAIYESRGWHELPILADALEEAGCVEPAVLTHLRGAGPHVPGCWAVDLVLGRHVWPSAARRRGWKHFVAAQRERRLSAWDE